MGASAEFIVGVFGNITGVCLFLSPVFTFYGVLKKKSTDSFSSTPYLCALLNCALWVLYGMPFVSSNGVLIVTINGAGAFLEVSYLSIFIRYAPKSRKIRTVLVGGILGVLHLLVVLVISFAVYQQQDRHTIAGILCVLVTIMMYAAPLSVMRLVMRTKSVECMPLPLSIMVLVNSGVWSAYALLTKDIYIMIPNLFGVLLGVAQLILYAYYRGAKSPGFGLELGQKSSAQPRSSNEMMHIMPAAGALEIPNPSSNMMEIVSLKTCQSVSASPQLETNVASSLTCGSTLPTYSTVAFSAHTLMT